MRKYEAKVMLTAIPIGSGASRNLACYHSGGILGLSVYQDARRDSVRQNKILLHGTCRERI